MANSASRGYRKIGRAFGAASALVFALTVGAATVFADASKDAAISEATARLFQAVASNDIARVQASLAAGADMTAKNADGRTPADIAVDLGFYPIAHYLLAVRTFREQNPDQRPLSEVVEAVTAAEAQPAARPAPRPAAPAAAKPVAKAAPAPAAEPAPPSPSRAAPPPTHYFARLSNLFAGQPAVPPAAEAGAAAPAAERVAKPLEAPPSPAAAPLEKPSPRAEKAETADASSERGFEPRLPPRKPPTPTSAAAPAQEAQEEPSFLARLREIVSPPKSGEGFRSASAEATALPAPPDLQRDRPGATIEATGPSESLESLLNRLAELSRPLAEAGQQPAATERAKKTPEKAPAVAKPAAPVVAKQAAPAEAERGGFFDAIWKAIAGLGRLFGGGEDTAVAQAETARESAPPRTPLDAPATTKAAGLPLAPPASTPAAPSQGNVFVGLLEKLGAFVGIGPAPQKQAPPPDFASPKDPAKGQPKALAMAQPAAPAQSARRPASEQPSARAPAESADRGGEREPAAKASPLAAAAPPGPASPKPGEAGDRGGPKIESAEAAPKGFIDQLWRMVASIEVRPSDPRPELGPEPTYRTPWAREPAQAVAAADPTAPGSAPTAKPAEAAADPSGREIEAAEAAPQGFFDQLRRMAESIEVRPSDPRPEFGPEPTYRTPWVRESARAVAAAEQAPPDPAPSAKTEVAVETGAREGSGRFLDTLLGVFGAGAPKVPEPKPSAERPASVAESAIAPEGEGMLGKVRRIVGSLDIQPSDPRPEPGTWPPAPAAPSAKPPTVLAEAEAAAPKPEKSETPVMPAKVVAAPTPVPAAPREDAGPAKPPAQAAPVAGAGDAGRRDAPRQPPAATGDRPPSATVERAPAAPEAPATGELPVLPKDPRSILELVHDLIEKETVKTATAVPGRQPLSPERAEARAKALAKVEAEVKARIAELEQSRAEAAAQITREADARGREPARPRPETAPPAPAPERAPAPSLSAPKEAGIEARVDEQAAPAVRMVQRFLGLFHIGAGEGGERVATATAPQSSAASVGQGAAAAKRAEPWPKATVVAEEARQTEPSRVGQATVEAKPASEPSKESDKSPVAERRQEPEAAGERQRPQETARETQEPAGLFSVVRNLFGFSEGAREQARKETPPREIAEKPAREAEDRGKQQAAEAPPAPAIRVPPALKEAASDIVLPAPKLDGGPKGSQATAAAAPTAKPEMAVPPVLAQRPPQTAAAPTPPRPAQEEPNYPHKIFARIAEALGFGPSRPVAGVGGRPAAETAEAAPAADANQDAGPWTAVPQIAAPQGPEELAPPRRSSELAERELAARGAGRLAPAPAAEEVADASGWAVRSLEIAQAVPRVPGRPAPAAAPPSILPGVVLTVGESATLGHGILLAQPEERRRGCIEKRNGTLLVCVEPVDWPPELRTRVLTNSVMYQGLNGVVRYDHGTATRYHVLFPSEEFETMVAYYTDRFGNPTETWKRSVTPFAASRHENPTALWRAVNMVTRRVTVLEIRKFDDSRGGFPDTKRGAVMLYYPQTDHVFPHVSTLELMRLRAK